MAWFERQRKSKYTYVCNITVEYGRGYSIRDKIPSLYSMKANNELGFKLARHVLQNFIEHIDDESFVECKINEREEYDPSKMVCGMGRLVREYTFFILTEDIEKVEKGPVHIICAADDFPDEKSEFIKLIAEFAK